MKGNIDNSIITRNAIIDDEKTDEKDISWYIHHYTPSVSQQDLLNQQTITEMPTDLSYIERSVCSKDVQQQSEWIFDLGVGERIDLAINVVVGFHQSERLNSQLLHKDSSKRPSVKFAQCIIGTERYPDAGINLNYAEDKNSQGYGRIVSCFTHLTKDDILQPYISQEDFITNNVNSAGDTTDDIGYKLFLFDIRYQKNFSCAQP